MADNSENQIQEEDELSKLAKDELRIATHEKLDPSMCGEVLELTESNAITFLKTNIEMVADNQDMIHAGFIFNAAAFCAVAAINDPTCVIVGADSKFLAPIELGNDILFTARALQKDSKKKEVIVTGTVLEIKVFEAMFYVVTFDKHILKLKLTRN